MQIPRYLRPSGATKLTVAAKQLTILCMRRAEFDMRSVNATASCAYLKGVYSETSNSAGQDISSKLAIPAGEV
jgi:hypothetical protein